MVAAHFLGDTAVFVLGEEIAAAGAARRRARARVVAHAGAILISAADGSRIITGGDDGKVRATAADGASAPLRRTASGAGSITWRPGRTARRMVGGQAGVCAGAGGAKSACWICLRRWAAWRLRRKACVRAVAHYNGVTLWFPNAPSATQRYWHGRVRISASPSVPTAFPSEQHAGANAARLAACRRKDIRLSGYSARVRSVDFSAGGKWLASSGATQLVVWPFQGKDGPLGKTPQLFAVAELPVQVVACHPKEQVVAAGYADGLVLLVRLDDGAEILARKGAASPITALAWSLAGDTLAFGTEAGEAGVIGLGAEYRWRHIKQTNKEPRRSGAQWSEVEYRTAKATCCLRSALSRRLRFPPHHQRRRS